MSVVLITGSCGLVGSESADFFSKKETLPAVFSFIFPRWNPEGFVYFKYDTIFY